MLAANSSLKSDFDTPAIDGLPSSMPEIIRSTAAAATSLYTVGCPVSSCFFTIYNRPLPSSGIFPKFLRKGETHLERAFRLAKPYLMRDIGGDALECVSDVAYADIRGIDGIIHISPFTCMPEIMSQNIFPSMRENCDIPILPLIMDEQTGKAGYLTRLEAFVDLMKRRKRKMITEKNNQGITKNNVVVE